MSQTLHLWSQSLQETPKEGEPDREFKAGGANPEGGSLKLATHRALSDWMPDWAQGSSNTRGSQGSVCRVPENIPHPPT
ncbi:Hypothetical predicted protein [Lynx pardinus]|uniref:Uncharacterized protein n=1 Tax=Lynx pardinus TaxID=191816 RepID=A0A485PMY5_LYNPA|nr:Hypothetical predicted protein [Lynx pardinus]